MHSRSGQFWPADKINLAKEMQNLHHYLHLISRLCIGLRLNLVDSLYDYGLGYLLLFGYREFAIQFAVPLSVSLHAESWPDVGYFAISVPSSGSKFARIHLKGQSCEIFFTRFFHQSTPSGPIRDVLGPLQFFLLFHGVIWFPGFIPYANLALPASLLHFRIYSFIIHTNFAHFFWAGRSTIQFA